MAANMKGRKSIYLFLVTISILLVSLVVYLRYKLGALECGDSKENISIQKYLLALKALIFGLDNDLKEKSLLCGRDIHEVCIHILAHQLPQDAKKYLFDSWASDPEWREFGFRLLALIGFVALTIYCNFCRWMASGDLHSEDESEEPIVNPSVSAVKTKGSSTPKIDKNSVLKHQGEHLLEKQPSGCRSWSLWKMCGITLLMFAILSIPWEFVRLYQTEVAKRAARGAIGSPPECFPEGMTIFQSLKSWIQHHFSWDHDNDPCEKYYYTLLVDPLWELTPLMVLSSALTRCILHPVEKLFSGLGRSCRLFFSEIPAQWQPVVMVVILLLTFVILLVVFRYRITIPFIFKIEPRTPVQNVEPKERRPYLCDHSPHNHSHHSHSYTPTYRLTSANAVKRTPIKPRGRRIDIEATI